MIDIDDIRSVTELDADGWSVPVGTFDGGDGIFGDGAEAWDVDGLVDPTTTELISRPSIDDFDVSTLFAGATDGSTLAGHPSTYFQQVFTENESAIRKPETFQLFERARTTDSGEPFAVFKRQLAQAQGRNTIPGLLKLALDTAEELGIDESHRGTVENVLGVSPFLEDQLVRVLKQHGVRPKYAKLAAFGTTLVLADGAIHAMGVSDADIESLTATLVDAVSIDTVEHELCLAFVLALGSELSRRARTIDVKHLVSVLEHVLRARSGRRS
ncbi:hypothetical protein [Halogeometricum limi]|uniref:Uncharacterized protein n=1 Tax=Halogeometricum limi TaxID=555875 RepID=A0A1I6GRW3_9EURY|nr:hypothetical protein [Halogeometricum limi]SFR44920.1 hypothetical protein SAMN04488124_1452 [Halogeometricum limi]